MLAHTRDMPAAQVSKPTVLRLLLMTLECFEEGTMLHDSVVHLTFEKIDATVHIYSRLMMLMHLQVAHHGPPIDTEPPEPEGSVQLCVVP